MLLFNRFLFKVRIISVEWHSYYVAVRIEKKTVRSDRRLFCKIIFKYLTLGTDINTIIG